MKCPHCSKTLELPDFALNNMEAYGKSCRIVTDCCGKMVFARPIVTFHAVKYEGEKTVDDWGNEPKVD